MVSSSRRREAIGTGSVLSDARVLLAGWRGQAEDILSRVDERAGGSVSVIRLAIERFSAARGPQAAASLSYYAFLSLFPLLVFVLLAAGSLLGREQVYGQVVQGLGQVLPAPFGQEVVGRTIEQILTRTSSLPLLAAIGLLWAGTGYFTALVFNIDLAWPETRTLNPVRRRLYGLLMVGILMILLVASLILNLSFDLLSRLEPLRPAARAVFERAVWPAATRILPEVVAFFLLFGLYWAVPKAEVRWKAAVGGSLAAVLSWRLVTWGFTRLVANGLTRYDVVYGSLGAVVGLLFWMYLSSWIVLLGAHLTAAIDCGVPRRTHGSVSNP
jgi:membrane protein